MKVAIVLVNYNNTDDTSACIDSLLRMKTVHEYRICVVDNASKEIARVKNLKKNNGDVEIIYNERNDGFACANNTGIRLCEKNKPDYYLLLNNDTEVAEDFLDKICEKAAESGAGLIGAKILLFSDKETIWYAGGKIKRKPLRAEHYGIWKKSRKYKNKEQETNFITGCCMMISKETINRIGVLDEDYFMYCEDMDYCLKAVSNGIKMVYAEDAIVYHKVGGSSGGAESEFSVKMNVLNHYILTEKHIRGSSNRDEFFWLDLYYLYKMLKYCFKGEEYIAKWILLAMKKARKGIVRE